MNKKRIHWYMIIFQETNGVKKYIIRYADDIDAVTEFAEKTKQEIEDIIENPVLYQIISLTSSSTEPFPLFDCHGNEVEDFSYALNAYCKQNKTNWFAETETVLEYWYENLSSIFQNGEQMPRKEKSFIPTQIAELAMESFCVLMHNVDSYGCDYDWVFGYGLYEILEGENLTSSNEMQYLMYDDCFVGMDNEAKDYVV